MYKSKRLLALLLTVAVLACVKHTVLAQTKMFVDLSSAQVADYQPTSADPSQPATVLEVAPGSLVRVTVGMQFETTDSSTRWYIASAYLPIQSDWLEIVTVDPSQPENNAFWHPHLDMLPVVKQVKVAVTPQTPPLRANLLKPLDTDSPVFGNNAGLWVVLAPGGLGEARRLWIGHLYVRVADNAPDGTSIPLAVTSHNDPSRIQPNSLLATDSSSRYHLFGTDLPAEAATLVVRSSQTVLQLRVHLRSFTWQVSEVTAELQIRAPGTTTPIRQYPITLHEGEEPSIPLDITGTYDVALKASHWLRQVVPTVNLSGHMQLDFSLINGDIDGDNEVTLFDFGMLVRAFGSAFGDDHWNPEADLDGDGEVTLFDFGVLVSSFGSVGDD
ncbi:MAG: dockerin type I domain-containing protein [Armatimonadota bacterium]